MRRLQSIAAAFALGNLLLLTGNIVAQPVPAAKGAVVPAVPEYRAKQILGTKVLIKGNIAIGTVDDIVFSDDGRVEYLLVLNDGKLVSVPWKAAKFNFDQRTAMVNVTQEQFGLIPRFGLGLFPRFFAPTYRVQTYKYYGMTPEPPPVSPKP
jgi:hypothetical protein